MKSAHVFRSMVAALVLPAVMVGCADVGSVYDSTTVLKTGGAVTSYLLNEAGTSSLMQFPLATAGAVSPAATLTLPTNFVASAVAVDPTSGVLYVGGIDPVARTSEILVYPASSAGVAVPTATITPVSSDFAEPLAMTVDASGKLYVASTIPAVSSTANDTPTVAVFASGATGAATPVKTIAGTSTGLYIPTGIAVDATGNVYVANADSATSPYSGVITIFAPAATGNAVPLRAVTNVSQAFNGVSVDASGNVYTVAQTLTITNSVNTYSNPKIVEYAAGVAGAATPIKTISGTLTGLATVGEIHLDSVGNIYVVNVQGTSSTAAVLGFTPAASGNVAPALKITSTALTAGAATFAIK